MGFFKIVTDLCDMVPGWLYAIFIACMLGVLGVQEVANLKMKSDLASVKLDVVTKENARSAAALKATELQGEISALRATHSQEIANVVTAEREKTAAAVADGNAVRDELRDRSRRLATFGGPGSNDPTTLADAEARATAFGKLLERCDGVAEKLGRSAEDLATQVRGLQASYASLFLRPGGVSQPLGNSK